MRSWEEGLNVNSQSKKAKRRRGNLEEEFFACLGTDYLSSQWRHDVVIYKGLLSLYHAHISSFFRESARNLTLSYFVIACLGFPHPY